MKKFIALMTALFAVIAIIFAYVVNSSPRVISSGETTVKEMPDTHIDIFHNYSMNYNECTRYFVISNPPDDFIELKNLLSDYLASYHAPDLCEFDIGMYTYKFLRETNIINTQWVESDDYMFIDRIEDHMDDCIATVYWQKDGSTRNYLLLQRSASRKDYGAIQAERDIVEEITR